MQVINSPILDALKRHCQNKTVQFQTTFLASRWLDSTLTTSTPTTLMYDAKTVKERRIVSIVLSAKWLYHFEQCSSHLNKMFYFFNIQVYTFLYILKILCFLLNVFVHLIKALLFKLTAWNLSGLQEKKCLHRITWYVTDNIERSSCKVYTHKHIHFFITYLNFLLFNIYNKAIQTYMYLKTIAWSKHSE